MRSHSNRQLVYTNCIACPRRCHLYKWIDCHSGIQLDKNYIYRLKSPNAVVRMKKSSIVLCGTINNGMANVSSKIALHLELIREWWQPITDQHISHFILNFRLRKSSLSTLQLCSALENTLTSVPSAATLLYTGIAQVSSNDGLCRWKWVVMSDKCVHQFSYATYMYLLSLVCIIMCMNFLLNALPRGSWERNIITPASMWALNT